MQIHPALFEFLKAIREENSRKYFASIRPLYDDIRQSLQDFIQTLANKLIPYNPDFALLEPKKCLYRIYRDARRLKPGDDLYKYNFGAILHPQGKKTGQAAAYLHLSPEGSYFGGGLYGPDRSQLNKLRDYLAKHGDEYYDIVDAKSFTDRFGQVRGSRTRTLLKRFKLDCLFPELTQRKQFLIYHRYSDQEVLSEGFFDALVQDYQTAKPFFDLLNKGLESS